MGSWPRHLREPGRQGSWSYQLTSDGTDPLGSHVQTRRGGGFLAASSGIAKPPPAVNAHDYRWVSATAPDGAAQIAAVLDTVAAAGNAIWVDEVRVRVSGPDNGVRVAAGLPAGATYDNWRAVSGVDYEYRAEVRSVIGTTVGGKWTP